MDQERDLQWKYPQALNTLLTRSTKLVGAGLYWLNVLAGDEKALRFSQWARLMIKASGKEETLTSQKLEWLWKSVTSDPDLDRFFGDRIVSLEEEWKQMETVECLPAGSRFGIFFKDLKSYGHPVLPLRLDLIPDAEAEIFEPLHMRPGKARRLECCDVPTRLHISVKNPGNVDAEAAALKVDRTDVEIKGESIIVNVKSLNHAYTKASLRLQPSRRSPGGRVYDHVAMRMERGFKALETVRAKHEKNLWLQLISTQ